MTEAIARFKPGENISVFAKKTLEAGRFVKIVGVSSLGAYEAEVPAEKANPNIVFGVTQRSAAETLGAEDQDRLIECCRPDCVARVMADGEVKIGEEVMVGSEGKAKKTEKGEGAVGIALSTGKNVFIEVDFRGAA